MRQAGRYLPEYRATRAQAGSFMGLAHQPALRHRSHAAAAGALRRWMPPSCSRDILTVPDAMGLGLHFAEGEGPRFARTRCAPKPTWPGLRGARPGLAALRVRRRRPDPPRDLNGRVPLIGFSGSPWTLACYMVEGGGSDDFRTDQDDAVRPSRPDAPHPGHQRPGRGAVPERPDRRGRPGRDGVRHLGRRAGRRRRSSSSRCVPRSKVVAGLQRETRRPPRAGHRFHARAAATGSSKSPLWGGRCHGPGLDGEPGPGAAHRWATRWPCRATWIRSALFARRGTRCSAEASRACWTRFGAGGNAAATSLTWVMAFRASVAPDAGAELVEEVHTLTQPFAAAELQCPT